MDYYEIARLGHIAAGMIALVTFWTAAVMRKGTARHRAIGRVYMSAMIGIMVSALPLAAAAFQAGAPVKGGFLLYLVLITGTGCLLAWRAIRMRQSVAAYTGGLYRPVAWLNVVAGAGILVLGIRYDAPLLYGMAIVGLVGGPAMLRFASRPPTDRGWWLARHYGGIIGCGVATHIAFLNIGLQRVVPGDFSAAAQYVAWFGPLLAAVIAGRWLDDRYGRRGMAA